RLIDLERERESKGQPVKTVEPCVVAAAETRRPSIVQGPTESERDRQLADAARRRRDSESELKRYAAEASKPPPPIEYK
ncbi:hypothetical protein KIPB_015947, partial [Kipferlia bialata]